MCKAPPSCRTSLQGTYFTSFKPSTLTNICSKGFVHKNVQFYLWQMEGLNNEGGLGRCGVFYQT